jgi:hypothetical protein
MRRLVLGLNAATVLLVVVGIVLLVVPPPVPAGRSPASMLSATGALPDSVRLSAPDLAAADRVVRTDIFSPRRSPPSHRSMLGELATEPEAAPADSTTNPTPAGGETTDSSSAPTASTAADAVPHLYGTMLGPVASTALLRLDANVPEPRLYHVGDRAGAYRVVEIGDRMVTLAGPNGRVVLRLKQPDE